MPRAQSLLPPSEERAAAGKWCLSTATTSSSSASKRRSSPSFDSRVSSRPNLRRNSYTEVLGHFGVDRQKRFLRPLDRQIRGIHASEDLSDVAGRVLETVCEIGTERR